MFDTEVAGKGGNKSCPPPVWLIWGAQDVHSGTGSHAGLLDGASLLREDE